MLRPMLFEQTKPLLWDTFYNDFFGNGLNCFENFSTDVIDKGDYYELQAELPGFKKDEIEINLDNETLTITASHNEEVNENKENYVRQERRNSTYSRSFHVNGISKESITAAYNNGVLELKLPKEKNVIVQPKKIEIQ